MSLHGPSRTIVVEPLRPPVTAPVPEPEPQRAAPPSPPTREPQPERAAAASPAALR